MSHESARTLDYRARADEYDRFATAWRRLADVHMHTGKRARSGKPVRSQELLAKIEAAEMRALDRMTAAWEGFYD